MPLSRMNIVPAGAVGASAPRLSGRGKPARSVLAQPRVSAATGNKHVTRGALPGPARGTPKVPARTRSHPPYRARAPTYRDWVRKANFSRKWKGLVWFTRTLSPKTTLRHGIWISRPSDDAQGGAPGRTPRRHGSSVCRRRLMPAGRLPAPRGHWARAARTSQQRHRAGQLGDRGGPYGPGLCALWQPGQR